MDSKIGFEMNLIVVEEIHGRCASFTVLTATVSEIFGGQTTPSILVVGDTGASCYGGRFLQGHFMQNYHIDGEIAYSSSIPIHQRNHWRNKTIDTRELFEIWTKITFDTPETFLRIFTTFLLVQSITKNGLQKLEHMYCI